MTATEDHRLLPADHFIATRLDPARLIEPDVQTTSDRRVAPSRVVKYFIRHDCSGFQSGRVALKHAAFGLIYLNCVQLCEDYIAAANAAVKNSELYRACKRQTSSEVCYKYATHSLAAESL